MPADLIGYLYAATVAAGGIMGYVKAGKYSRNFWSIPLDHFFFLKLCNIYK